jgi:hypothetical protein
VSRRKESVDRKCNDAGASNGTINRELTAIRRAYCYGIKKEPIFSKPQISLSKENNVRQGFFEREQFEAVRRRLPERRIKSFRKAWARACYGAGLPCIVRYQRDSNGEVEQHREGPQKGNPIEHIEAEAYLMTSGAQQSEILCEQVCPKELQ